MYKTTAKTKQQIRANGFVKVVDNIPLLLKEELIKKAKNIVVINAFSDDRFKGNPSGVMLTTSAINPAEICFLVEYLTLPVITVLKKIDYMQYEISWFTKNCELDLCGHGTLAASYFLFNTNNTSGNTIKYKSRSGKLFANINNNGSITLELPTFKNEAPTTKLKNLVESVLNLELEDLRVSSDDIIAVASRDKGVIDFIPNDNAIAHINYRGIILSASITDKKYAEFDIVSRFFAPNIAISEDQVCVSAHTKLFPYWSSKLNSKFIIAWQASARGGRLELSSYYNKVKITGTVKMQ